MAQPCSHVAWRRIDDETFIIDLNNKVMYGLNATGGDVWSMLEEGHNLNTIIESIGASFDDKSPPQDLEFSIYRFLKQLETFELISCDAEFKLEASPAQHETFPSIVWQEELVSIGYSCADKPGQTPTCTQVPSQ